MPNISIDWLSFSCENFKTANTQKLLDFFYCVNDSFGVTFEIKRGLYGFEFQKISELGFSIFYGNDNKTTLFQIHGQGCSLIDSKYPGGVRQFLIDFRKYFVSITRLDLCADDFDGLLSIPTIEKKVYSGMLRGSARHVRPFIPKDYNGNSVSGGTIYVGVPQSDTYIRIYDKQAQTGTDHHWVRVEIELKHKYAVDVADMIINSQPEEISKLYCSIIYDRVRFLSRKGSDTHTARDDRVCSWWSKFLDGCSVGLKLTRDDMPSLSSVSAWLDRSVSPSLAMAASAYGEDYVKQLLANGSDRMSLRHKNILAEYAAEVRELRRDEEVL